jgi:hypothetical protein
VPRVAKETATKKQHFSTKNEKSTTNPLQNKLLEKGKVLNNFFMGP